MPRRRTLFLSRRRSLCRSSCIMAPRLYDPPTLAADWTSFALRAQVFALGTARRAHALRCPPRGRTRALARRRSWGTRRRSLPQFRDDRPGRVHLVADGCAGDRVRREIQIDARAEPDETVTLAARQPITRL